MQQQETSVRHLMLSSSTGDLSEWDKKGPGLTGKEFCVEFLPAPWIPQCEAFTFGFDSLEKLTRTQQALWTFRFLRVWWEGGGQLRNENVKYAVLNSQQGNMTPQRNMAGGRPPWLLGAYQEPRHGAVYSRKKGKTETQGQICISIQLSIR